jgi:hypothetical protein
LLLGNVGILEMKPSPLNINNRAKVFPTCKGPDVPRNSGEVAMVFWTTNSGYGRRLEDIEVSDREKLAKVHIVEVREV